MDDIAITYDALQSQYGVEFIFDRVAAVDPETRSISLQSGDQLSYDRLNVSPGIDFIWDQTEGYSEEVANSAMPHSWKAGEQTVLLKRQIDAMPDDGTMIIVPRPTLIAARRAYINGCRCWLKYICKTSQKRKS